MITIKYPSDLSWTLHNNLKTQRHLELRILVNTWARPNIMGGIIANLCTNNGKDLIVVHTRQRIPWPQTKAKL